MSGLLYRLKLATKWKSLAFHYYTFFTQHLQVSPHRSEVVEANLSESRALEPRSSGVPVLLGLDPSSLTTTNTPPCWEYGWLGEICLSEALWWGMCSAAPLMRTQVAQCYFCWGLVYSITSSQSAATGGGGKGPESAACGRSTWRRRSHAESMSSIQLVDDGEQSYEPFNAFFIKCWAKVWCVTFGLIQDLCFAVTQWLDFMSNFSRNVRCHIPTPCDTLTKAEQCAKNCWVKKKTTKKIKSTK